MCERCAELEKCLKKLNAAYNREMEELFAQKERADKHQAEAVFWHRICDNLERERQGAMLEGAICKHFLVDGTCIMCGIKV